MKWPWTHSNYKAEVEAAEALRLAMEQREKVEALRGTIEEMREQSHHQISVLRRLNKENNFGRRLYAAYHD